MTSPFPLGNNVAVSAPRVGMRSVGVQVSVRGSYNSTLYGSAAPRNEHLSVREEHRDVTAGRGTHTSGDPPAARRRLRREGLSRHAADRELGDRPAP